jgi:hypothetical protein
LFCENYGYTLQEPVQPAASSDLPQGTLYTTRTTGISPQSLPQKNQATNKHRQDSKNINFPSSPLPFFW